jgi:spore germination protein YaaH
MRRNWLVILTIILLTALCLIMGYQIWVWINTPNDTEVGFFDDIPGTRLIIGSRLIQGSDPPIVREGRILLSFDTIKEYIDPYIWWDEPLQKVTITTADRVIRMKTDSLEALVNEEPMELKFPAVKENDVLYLPIDFLKDFYGIEIRYVESNDVVVIDFKNSIYRIGFPLSAEAVIRTGMDTSEPILKRFTDIMLDSEEARLVIFEEYEKWYRVRTYDGIFGFIMKADTVVRDISIVKAGREAWPEAPPIPIGKICLVWDMTYSKKYIEFSKTNTPGIDVISPTWFEIVDAKGTIKNRADMDYVEWAHSNGWRVWALFSNNFSDIEGTSNILNNSDARREIIRSILAYASLYSLDGINVDFENIYKSDKDAYTQFIRELYPLLKEQGLTVSVDVGVPGGSDTWSLCYDRKALSESVDYICLMTYDQHYASSPVAGSTAELEWVEKCLRATLEEVPPEKLLLGIPLYTRLWTETVSDGKVKVSSKALTIASAWRVIEENNAQVVWSESSGQYATQFEKDGVTQKMWIEDADAVNTKTSLIHKYNTAGACIWAANFADENVWPVFERNLKQVAHYEEWKEKHSSPPQ